VADTQIKNAFKQKFQEDSKVSNKIPRRHFMAAAALGTMWAVPHASTSSMASVFSKEASKLALLGGAPIRTKSFPNWPIWDTADEQNVIPVLRSGTWSRANVVNAAEEKFANLMGTKRCLLTFCGTQALIVSLHTAGVGGGDEVIVTPYTFVATIDAILNNNALPVFADVDPDTWSLDPEKVKKKITKNTYALLPVHIGGSPANMDAIMEIAKMNDLRVVEDACQAHMSEWKGKKVGSFGDFGCFSLQNSKVITCGEGGAIISNNEELMDLAYSFHNFARPYGSVKRAGVQGHLGVGTKARISEFQAAILSTQMDTSDQEVSTREGNAKYLAFKLNDIPGIIPRKEYPQTTRVSFHYWGFRYKKEHWDGLSRDKFMEALGAEGISLSKQLGNIEGLSQNREGPIDGALNSKTFKAIYSKKRIQQYREGLDCPIAEQLITEIVGVSQNKLLGTRKDMDDIVNAVTKIYENRKELVAKI
jgi:perosamine synthetase